MSFDVFLLFALHVNRKRTNKQTKQKTAITNKKNVMREKKIVLFKSCMNVVDTREAVSLKSITERLSSD